MKQILLLSLLLGSTTLIIGCTSDTDFDSGINKSPVYQQSPPPGTPTTPGNDGTLSDPTRNTLNETGASEQDDGSSPPADATGGEMGQ